MSNEKEEDNKKITTLYKKFLKKSFNLDKIQPNLDNHGDDIQTNLDNITKITKKIEDDIKDQTKDDIIKVDFKKKEKEKK